MCYRKACKVCGKTTWGGCGRHVEDALEDVPEEELCKCPRLVDHPVIKLPHSDPT